MKKVFCITAIALTLCFIGIGIVAKLGSRGNIAAEASASETVVITNCPLHKDIGHKSTCPICSATIHPVACSEKTFYTPVEDYALEEVLTKSEVVKLDRQVADWLRTQQDVQLVGTPEYYKNIAEGVCGCTISFIEE